MKKRLEKVRDTLLDEKLTLCILDDDKITLKSTQRGIRPLVELYDSDNKSFGSHACAADKVVGAAAAFMYVLLGIKFIYADVISWAAVDILRENGIGVLCFNVVDEISNRDGTGRCPMESAVLGIKDPQMALVAIRCKLCELSASK